MEVESKTKPDKKNQRGGTYCRPEMKGKHTGKTSSKYCPKCKMKIRGNNHEEGSHHKTKVK